MNKAVFMDRDGTINEEVSYLHRIEDFKFICGVPELIKRFNEEGYKVIVVTNQAGIARGYYTEQEMNRLHIYINQCLAQQYRAHIDAFYHCPHHPAITGECNCRKPKTGMLERAIKDFEVDVSRSLLLGDQPWDIEAGKRMGIASYYIGEYLKK